MWRLIVPFEYIRLMRVRLVKLTTNRTLDPRRITYPSLKIERTSWKSKNTSKSTNFTRKEPKVGRKTKVNVSI